MSAVTKTKAARPEVKSTIITRTSKSGKKYTYEAKIIQQPNIARACGQGEKATKDRRPVDPPPVVQLQIFEGEGPDRVEVSHQYPANFFVHATIEWDSQPKAEASTKLLAGSTNTGGTYLERPCRAVFFIFGDLSVRYEGFFKLKFHIFEMPFCHHDNILDVVRDAGHPNNSCGLEGVFAMLRMQAQSARFETFSAKKFPGLSESTALSRMLSDQGCKVRIRRDVRVRKHTGKDTPMNEEDGVVSDDEDDEVDVLQDQYPLTPASARPSEFDRKTSVTGSVHSLPTPVQHYASADSQQQPQQQQSQSHSSQQSQPQTSQSQSQESSHPTSQSSTTQTSHQSPQQPPPQAQYPQAQAQALAPAASQMLPPVQFPQSMAPPPYPHTPQAYGPPHMPPPQMPYAYSYPPPGGYPPYPYMYSMYPHPYPPPYHAPTPVDPRYASAPPQPQQMLQLISVLPQTQQTMPSPQQPRQSPVHEQQAQQLQPQQPNSQQQSQPQIIIEDDPLASSVPGYYHPPPPRPPIQWARGADVNPPEYNGPLARDYRGEWMPISEAHAAIVQNHKAPPIPAMWASADAKAKGEGLKRSFGEYSRHDDEEEEEEEQDEDVANEKFARQELDSLRRGMTIKRAGIREEVDWMTSHAQAEAAVRGRTWLGNMASC